MSGPTNLNAARAISDACVDRALAPKWDHLPPLQRAVEVREFAPVEGLLAWADATAEPKAGKLSEAELDSHNADFHRIEEFPPMNAKSALVAAAVVVLSMAASALLPIWTVTP